MSPGKGASRALWWSSSPYPHHEQASLNLTAMHKFDPKDFPEGKMILRGLLSSVGRKIKHIENCLVSMYTEPYDDETKNFIAEVVKSFYLRPLIKKRNLYMRQYAFYQETKKNTLNIEKAKQVKIQDLFSPEKARKTSTRIHCKCPFHQEKDGSFVIYLKNNTYNCFGCHEAGDSISFVKKYFNKNFVDAVKFLESQ